MNDIPYELIARYLAGECNDDEKRRVKEWSRQHPELMDEFLKIWNQTLREEFLPDVESALQKVNRRLDAKKGSQTRRILMWASSAAAVILLLCIIGIRTWNASKVPDIVAASLSTIQTNTDETLEHVLADGSRVWLNRSSLVRHPETFENNVREIYLEGEAFFDIVPDAEKPFIIHAGGTQTRVVGTSFGIKAFKGANEVVVTVSTGVVNLSAEGKADKIVLTQGEQGICNPERQKLEKNDNPDPNALAWKTKLLVFKQTSLTEVSRVIENVYGTTISTDSSVTNLQLTGTYDQLSLEELLQIIEMTLQIQAKPNENGILLTH